MKFKTITYQKVMNLSNYNSQRLEITAEVDTEDEDQLNDKLNELHAIVHDALARFKEIHTSSGEA